MEAELALKQGLVDLQKEYDMQGKLECLEETLSKLKHTYAVEILASSGQLGKAREMLKEIPSSYSDYPEVEKKLQQ